MDLLTFLVITIILCSLILLVQGDSQRFVQVLAVVCIVLEVLYILLAKGVYDPGLQISLQKVIPCTTGFLGLVGIIKLSERSIPLLIIFTSLLQFFIETTIIQAIR